jgi:hypothetical protein
MNNTDLVIVDRAPPSPDLVEADPASLAIGAGVHNMFQRTHSQRTRDTYEKTIKAFRARAKVRGLDLDSDRGDLRDPLQVWAAEGAGESGATMNQRLAIISSF